MSRLRSMVKREDMKIVKSIDLWANPIVYVLWSNIKVSALLGFARKSSTLTKGLTNNQTPN